MSGKTRSEVDRLVSHWQSLRSLGQTATLDEICANCPEHLDELKQRLRDLESMEKFLASQDAGLVATASEAGSTRSPAQPQAAGSATLPGFELLEELGHGGMGVVYLARQQNLKRLVAIKMVLAGAHLSPEQRDRFRAEAESVAQLQHPNIVQIFETGEHVGQPYFCMEYVPGQSLSQRVKQGPLPPREAAALVETLARAIQHAHQRGVVHRDLKPANVLLTEDGTPKVTDFGLAKRLEDGDGARTRTGAVMGTPSYMAPEQAEGKTAEIGPLADVYALGAILYELLTGAAPFRGDSVMKTLHQVIHTEPIPPSKKRPNIDRDLETICLKTLAKAPTNRYPSALALAQDLERYQAGEPILARRESWMRKIARATRKRATTISLVVALLVALLTAGWFVRRSLANQEIAQVNREFEQELDRPEWSKQQRARLEELEKQLAALAQEDAPITNQRLTERGVRRFREGLRQPRLDATLIGRLDEELAWLRARDSRLGDELSAEYRRRLGAWNTVVDVAAPFTSAASVFPPNTFRQENQTLINAAPDLRPGVARPVEIASSVVGPLRIELEWNDTWTKAAELGLTVLFTAADTPKVLSYEFLWIAVRPALVDQGDGLAPKQGAATETTASFRESNSEGKLEIRRNGVVIQSRTANGGNGPLRLVIEQSRDQLLLRLNGGDVVSAFDAIPLQGSQGRQVGVCSPNQVGLTRCLMETKSLPPDPSPLERAEEEFEKGNFTQASALFLEQARVAENPEIATEARCKAGLALLEVNREEDAQGHLETVAAAQGVRWPIIAACRLWLIRLNQKRFADANTLFASIQVRYSREQIIEMIPQSLRDKILGAYNKDFSFSYYLRVEPDDVRRFESVIKVRELLSSEPFATFGFKMNLMLLRELAGDRAGAIEIGKDLQADAVPVSCLHELAASNFFWVQRWYLWILRQANSPEVASGIIDNWTQERHPSLANASASTVRHIQAPLFLEQARIHADGKRWEAVDASIKQFFARGGAELPSYAMVSPAYLMQGFVEQARNRPEQAKQIWRDGLFAADFERRKALLKKTSISQIGRFGVLDHWTMASLSGSMTDAQAKDILQQILQWISSNPLFAQGIESANISANVVRGAWSSPRGQRLAEQMAFRQIAPGEYFRAPARVLAYEKVCQDVFDSKPTPEEDEIIWGAVRQISDQFCAGEISQNQMLCLAFAWKGSLGLFGWSGIAPHLKPESRAPLAYVMGQRFLKLKKAAEAKTLFQAALADAPQGSPLSGLAKKALQ